MVKKVIKIIVILIIGLIITNISYAKYITVIQGSGRVTSKIPIIILEQNDLVSGEISKTKNNYQLDFNLKNYFETGNKINEIDFEYTIKLIPSTLNFPVKYKLVNLDTNDEIFLNENLETNKIFMGTIQTIHRYRVIVEWADITYKDEVEANLEVKMKIKAEQIKKENV